MKAEIVTKDGTIIRGEAVVKCGQLYIKVGEYHYPVPNQKEK